MEQFINLVLIFFSFSLVGWCIEVVLKYRQYHRFINRGFLTGPCLPIYGSGAALITISMYIVLRWDDSIGTTFVVSFIICGTIEYLASFFMEKKFHARWWDYSQRPMNLNGRIWIGNLILFGLGGLIIHKVANPLLLQLFSNFTLVLREIVAAVLSVIFVADYILSHFVMKLVKQGIEKSEADNTEEIGREIKLLLSDKAIFYRRFADAYPDVIYRTEKVMARMEAIKAETEKLRAQAEEKIDELTSKLDNSIDGITSKLDSGFDEIASKLDSEKEQLIASLESSSSIKSTIISKQDELIAMLYKQDEASDEMKELVAFIDEKKQIIQNRQKHSPAQLVNAFKQEKEKSTSQAQ